MIEMRYSFKIVYQVSSISGNMLRRIETLKTLFTASLLLSGKQYKKQIFLRCVIVPFIWINKYCAENQYHLLIWGASSHSSFSLSQSLAHFPYLCISLPLSFSPPIFLPLSLSFALPSPSPSITLSLFGLAYVTHWVAQSTHIYLFAITQKHNPNQFHWNRSYHHTQSVITNWIVLILQKLR